MAGDSIQNVRHRVWCETLSFEELGAPAVLRLLARYKVEALVAVRPWQVEGVKELMARLGDAGIDAALWPMLEDAHGRWVSTRSAGAFVELVDELLSSAPATTELVLDLEPPFGELSRWKAHAGSAALRAASRLTWRGAAGAMTRAAVAHAERYARAKAQLVAAITRWRDDRGSRRITTAVMPMLPFDGRGQWMQRALGTPADDLPVHRHSVMTYTSMLEGWSGGLVDRRRAEWLLTLCARRARARWGERAALSLGAVGTGAFGDEPVLRSPAELARDVALARAAGITELSLFELGGVLRRSPAEAWLEALCQ